MAPEAYVKKTFYRNNLLSFHGIVVIRYKTISNRFKTLAPVSNF
jgi:hypothetical protein